MHASQDGQALSHPKSGLILCSATRLSWRMSFMAIMAIVAISGTREFAIRLDLNQESMNSQ